MKSQKNKKILHNKTKKKYKNNENEEKAVICYDYSSIENDTEQKLKNDFKDKSKQSNFNLENFLIQLIRQTNNYKVKPQNDYYTFINGRWIDAFKLSKTQYYITKKDDFRLLQNKVLDDLNEIFLDYIKNEQNKDTSFYKSFLNYYKSAENFFVKNFNDEFIINDAYKIVGKIDKLLFSTNLYELLAWINTNEMVCWASPIYWKLQSDVNDPKNFGSFILQPKLTLLDITVYFNDGINVEYKRKYKKRYFSYLKELFTYFFGKGHLFNVEDVFNCETKIAIAFSCSKNLNITNFIFSKINSKDSLEKYKLDWDKLSFYLDLKDNPGFYYTADTKYLECIMKILHKEWNTKEWRTYWIYIYLKIICRYSYSSAVINYNFNSKYQRGTTPRMSNSSITSVPVSYAFYKFTSEKYAKKFTNENNIQYVRILCYDLQKVFIKIINRNNWLEKSTKEKCIDKVKNIKFAIGSYDNLIKEPILDYTEHLWDNLKKISHYYYLKKKELIGKPIVDFPEMDWSLIPAGFAGNQNFNVNAFYIVNSNSVYVPLAYIQKPFIDLENRSFIYNCAYIGLTIAHELSHSLDEYGRQFNKNGKLDDFWSKKDILHYQAIQKNIVKQIETYALRDGIKYDAWFNIDEIIADISGFTIIREYLRDYLYINNINFVTAETSIELLFSLVASTYRQKIDKKAIQVETKTNTHPLSKYRCNVVFSRSRIFREIYNVKKGDGMWWPETNRIWED
jgi:putative endopeptidase